MPGGGVALIYASKILDFLVLENADQNIGKKIFQEALRKPTEILATNANLNGRYIVNELITKFKDYKIGFDLNSGLKKILKNLAFLFLIYRRFH